MIRVKFESDPGAEHPQDPDIEPKALRFDAVLSGEADVFDVADVLRRGLLAIGYHPSSVARAFGEIE